MSEPASTNEQVEMARLLALSEQELLILLGQRVSPQMHGIDPRMLAAIAKAWLREHWSEFREAVCGNPAIEKARQASASDKTVLVAAVADALSSVVQGPGVMAASVLLIRYGLDHLCLAD